tara:strand:+ start:5688 stop:6020 length:333 start_codon:yes stop_codon:yes gene_type:complete
MADWKITQTFDEEAKKALERAVAWFDVRRQRFIDTFGLNFIAVSNRLVDWDEKQETLSNRVVSHDELIGEYVVVDRARNFGQWPGGYKVIEGDGVKILIAITKYEVENLK